MRSALLVSAWPLLVALAACSEGGDACLDHDDEIPKATSTRTAAAAVEHLVLADGTRVAQPIAYADGDTNVVYVDRTLGQADAGGDASPPDDSPLTNHLARLSWAASRLPAEAMNVTVDVVACPTATQRLDSSDRCVGGAAPERWAAPATLRRVRRDAYTLTIDHPRLRARGDVGWIYPCRGY